MIEEWKLSDLNLKLRKTCKKCGLPLGFKLITSGKGKGKYCPTNPDGSDHWDTCREERMKDPVYKARMLAMDKEAMKPVTTKCRIKKVKFYNGDIPPWDESLGDFQ